MCLFLWIPLLRAWKFYLLYHLTVSYITIWVFTTQIFSSGFVNFKKTNKISTLAVSCFTDSFLTREVSAVRVFIGCECVSVWEHWCRHMTRACLWEFSLGRWWQKQQCPSLESPETRHMSGQWLHPHHSMSYVKSHTSHLKSPSPSTYTN